MLFEAIVMICTVGIKPTVETCSIPTLGVYTDRKLCRDVLAAFRESLPPGRRLIMQDCAPAATKKLPSVKAYQ